MPGAARPSRDRLRARPLRARRRDGDRRRGDVNYLDEDRVEGEDPLAPFGPNAADHVRRTDGFPHCADLVVNSTYWPEFGEVAAFEELVGSHGGMGGTQSFPFVLHPADLAWPEEEVVGAEAGPPDLPRLAGRARAGRPTRARSTRPARAPATST